MEKVSTQSNRIIAVLTAILLICFYTNIAKANTTPSGNQLAYYIGYHTDHYYEPHHYHHHHYRKPYWTGWRYIGHGCRKNCLVDRWSGRIIRCDRVCRHYAK